MNQHPFSLKILFCLFLATLPLVGWGALSLPKRNDVVAWPNKTLAFSVPDNRMVGKAYKQPSMSFEANLGQVDKRVHFLTRNKGYNLYLTSNEAVMDLNLSGSPSSILKMKLKDARPSSSVVGQGELPTKSSYFIGNSAKNWTTDIPHYEKVRYNGVYPGVDLIYYGRDQQLEYDFCLAPMADLDQIQIEFEGADKVEIARNGDLVLNTPGGEVRFAKPMSYQLIGERKQVVASSYELTGDSHVKFAVNHYDPHLPLIIDPIVSYSSYLGGNSDDTAQGIAVDGSGNIFITGFTSSVNFPTTAGSYHSPTPTSYLTFVTKLNPAGNQVIYTAFIDGAYTHGIAVDAAGNSFITGIVVRNSDFPTTPGAYQTVANIEAADAFVTKINAAGNGLVYSTFLGGNGGDESYSIAVDSAGNAYVAGGTAKSASGQTTTNTFPVTPGAFQTTSNNIGSAQDAFVTKINSSGTGLIYSSLLGGNDEDQALGIAVDPSGYAYVTGFARSKNFPVTPGAFQTVYRGAGIGEEAFVTKVNVDGSSLAYSTYLGGSSNSERANSIAVDPAGNAMVTGRVGSSDFPTTPGAFQQTFGVDGSDAFVTKLNASGNALIYSTYLGGRQPGTQDVGYAIATDPAGNAYVTGNTSATNFPQTSDALPITFPNQLGLSPSLIFFTKLSPTGAGIFSSYILGGGYDQPNGIVVNTAGEACLAGQTFSSSFVTSQGALQPNYGGGRTDAFVIKVGGLGGGTVPEPTPTPTPTPTIPPPPLPAGLFLLTEENSSHAAALETVTMMRDPIGVVNPTNFSQDQRSRLTFFAINLDLSGGKDITVVNVQAIDAQNKTYTLPVEYVGKASDFNWLTQVVVKLPNQLIGAGDVQVSLILHGVESNKVLITLR